MLNGHRTVTIVQKRMLDDEKQKVEGLRAAIGDEWDATSVESDVDAKCDDPFPIPCGHVHDGSADGDRPGY